MVKDFVIFAVIIFTYHANTNLKNPQYRCNTTSKVCGDDPSVLGLFTMKPHENFSLDNLPGEIWKDIPGYEGHYQVSSLGRVKSLFRKLPTKTVWPKILHQFKNKQGYLSVYLTFKIETRKGSTRAFLSHRAVLYGFYGIKKMPVDHKNSIKDDNRLENLEYVTDRENTERYYSKKERKHKYPTGVSPKRNKFYAKIRTKGRYWNLGVFNTPEEASLAYQIAKNDIENIERYSNSKLYTHNRPCKEKLYGSLPRGN